MYLRIGLIAASAALVLAGCGSFPAGMPADSQTLTEVEPDLSNSAVIPEELKRDFGLTDWSIVDSKLQGAVSGGPGKDGIPSIDTPTFLPIASFDHPDSVQAIVMNDGDDIKVYPYNILTWHEIVNDTVNGVPVAVTFCPLCGSAIVFDRRVDNEALTFGVSGFLLESNMIMFDRENEALWQQSTGRALAGRDSNTELQLAPFQLMTMGEIKNMYPQALVLSEDTGHPRDYGRNPYAGYEDSEGYYFAPSREDARYPSKMIFVVSRYGGEIFGIPLPELADGAGFELSVGGDTIEVERLSETITITDPRGEQLPFYFEMWFSFASQHGADAIVFDPAT